MGARIAVLKAYSIIILQIFLTASLIAQPADIKFEHLTVQDGLSDNRVQFMIQDHKGFMWFGTLEGLNKYDGYRFTIYKNDPDDSTSLPGNFIAALHEDHSGDLWIATMGGGLCRYDRNHDTFIRYSYEKDNPNSLCGNQIVSIFETEQHVLWIGCDNGLNKYNHESDNFIRYYPDEKKSEFEANVNYIGAITQDRTGRLWIGTWNEGLFYYDAERDTFINYKPHPKYDKTFTNQFTTQLLSSRWRGKDYLWFASYQYGLYKIDLEEDEITRYKHEADNPNSISDNRIRTICQPKKESEQLWIGTEAGLDRLDTQTEEFTRYRHQQENQWSPNHNYINSIFKDKSDLMWLGTPQGVDKFDPNSANFKIIQQDAGNPEGLSGREVWAIHESTIGANRALLWLGTDRGLYMLDRGSERFTVYQNSPVNINSLSHNVISSIIETRLENGKILWVGTENGLNKFDPKKRLITRYYIPTNDPGYNQIYTLCEDKNGMIWIGTQSPYLYSFDPETDQFNRHGRYGVIRSLYIDTSEKLWIGTIGNGLFVFNPTTKKERHYRHIAGDLKSISDNWVRFILEDKNGTLWIGTGEGLNKLDRSTEIFTCFDEKDGLISNKVRAMLEDNHGNLWISTDKGISRFNPNSEEFRNFTVNDGLHHNEFWWGAHINHRGEMFFGGTNGLTYFHPDSIKDNSYVSPVVLTDFQIFNKSVQPGENSPLQKQVSEVSEITLSHDQSIFSFEFAALEYRKPEKIKYAYMMENVDPDWVSTDASRRFVTYTQLDPGEYIFRVKASNADGIWNEQGTSVKITVLPPWWKTWWAYSIYAFLILSTLYGLRQYELSRQRFKHQMELEHVEAEKFQELDKMKSRFFANISHEFRTPLTLIQGPVRQMFSGEFRGNLKETSGMILRYSDRLLNLINQILDLSKLESGRMILRVSHTNIIQYLKGVVQSFASLAERKKITLKFKVDEESLTGFVDSDKLDKIVTNLLSNAFKFTPKGGKVEVDLSLRGDSRSESMEATTYGLIEKQSPSSREDEIAMSRRVGRRLDSSTTRNDPTNSIEIKIFNSGAGIPPDRLNKIFDRFYQADESHTKDSEGTGIGLALTKELVEAHHGEILVESELNWGTTFTVWLPIEKEFYKLEEIVEESPKDEKISNIPLSPSSKGEIKITPLEGGAQRAKDVLGDIRAEENVATPKISKSAPLLLIVEDNPDVTAYISSFLEKDYRIITAENGEEGLKKVLKKFPNLIISDVMMPVMDGFQFCRKLKSDQRTSHIPLILLTARADMESKLEGLEFGADDYVTKPFDARELSVRSKNLLEQRRHLREHFEREVNFQPAEITVNSVDEQFIQKAIELIEQHMDDTDFSAEKFSREIGMSHQHLNRKLRAITNYSARDFIRTIRLKRAAQLLNGKSDTVTQIAYQVGFNNPSYFAECFRQQFGISPSQYTAQHSK